MASKPYFTLEHHISPGFDRIVLTDGYEFSSKKECDERLEQLRKFYGHDKVTALDELLHGDTMVIGILMPYRL